jgi:hypothetical protein
VIDTVYHVSWVSSLCGLNADERHKKTYLARSTNPYMIATLNKADLPYKLVFGDIPLRKEGVHFQQENERLRTLLQSNAFLPSTSP